MVILHCKYLYIVRGISYEIFASKKIKHKKINIKI